MAKRETNQSAALPYKMTTFLFFFELLCIVSITVNFAVALHTRHTSTVSSHGQLEADEVDDSAFSNVPFYEESIQKFQSSEEGSQLFAELSALEGIEDSNLYNKNFEDDIETNDRKTNSGKDGNNNKHGKKAIRVKSSAAMLKQYNEYAKYHPKIATLVPKLKKAVETVFGKRIEGSTNSSSTTRRFGSSSQTTKNDEEGRKRHAIILENVLQVMRHLPENQKKLAMQDKKYFAKKLIRGDLEMDDEEFRRHYLGLTFDPNEEIETELPSFLRNNDTEADPSFLNMEAAANNSQICSPSALECDRRKIDNSCENRLGVEDQGSGCGSCWAFASNHYLALAHCVATGRAINYSEQELLDCFVDACDGGSFSNTYSYLVTKNRISSESAYGYMGKSFYCTASGKPNVWTGSFDVKNYVGVLTKEGLNLSDKEWIHLIKTAVGKYGAVVYYLNSDRIRFNQGFVEMCDEESKINHGAVLTGWKLVNGRPAWIVRNSWGTWWGEDGYAYISMEENCRTGHDPIAGIQAVPVEKWSDENSGGGDINDDNENAVKRKGISKGEKGKLFCETGEITVLNTTIAKTLNGLSYEKPTSLNFANICNGKTSCSVEYPLHHPEDYETLRIAYKCTGRGSSKVDCNKARGLSGLKKDDTWCIATCDTLAFITADKDPLKSIRDSLSFVCDLSDIGPQSVLPPSPYAPLPPSAPPAFPPPLGNNSPSAGAGLSAMVLKYQSTVISIVLLLATIALA